MQFGQACDLPPGGMRGSPSRGGPMRTGQVERWDGFPMSSERQAQLPTGPC